MANSPLVPAHGNYAQQQNFTPQAKSPFVISKQREAITIK